MSNGKKSDKISFISGANVQVKQNRTLNSRIRDWFCQTWNFKI